MVTVFVLDVPEFMPLIRAAEKQADCKVSRHGELYYRIDSDRTLEFRRKELGVKPAIWYGLFTGGITGSIETFDRDVVRITAGKTP